MTTYSGSLAQLHCGEGGEPPTNTTGKSGECLKWMDHTELVLVLPRSTLLRLPSVPETICLTHLPGPGRFVPQVHHEGTGTRRAMCLRRVAELRL